MDETTHEETSVSRIGINNQIQIQASSRIKFREKCPDMEIVGYPI